MDEEVKYVLRVATDAGDMTITIESTDLESAAKLLEMFKKSVISN